MSSNSDQNSDSQLNENPERPSSLNNSDHEIDSQLNENPERPSSFNNLSREEKKVRSLENEIAAYRKAYQKQEQIILNWQDNCVISNTKLKSAEMKIAELAVEVDDLKAIIGALSLKHPQQSGQRLLQSDIL